MRLSNLEKTDYHSTKEGLDPSDVLYLLRKHKKLALVIMTLSFASAFFVIQYMPKRYEATTQILVEQPSSSSIIGGQGGLLNDVLGSPSATSMETQVEIARSRPQLEKVMKTLDLHMPIEQFDRSIYVVHPKLTEVIEITASADTPIQAAIISNQIGKEYEAFVHDRHHRETSSTASDVRKRLEETEKKLTAINKQSLNWLKAHHYAVPDREFEEILKTRLSLESENKQLKWHKLALMDEQTLLSKEIKKQAPFIESEHHFGTTAAIDTLQQTLADLEIKRANLLNEFQPNQPEVLANRTQIRSARAQLKTALAKSVSDDLVITEKSQQFNPLRLELTKSLTTNLFAQRSQDARQKAIDAILPKLQSKSLSFPAETQELRDISRKQNATNGVWAMLMTKYEELKVREYAAAMRTQVLEPAVPPIHAAKPRPLMYSGIALLCGLLFTAFGIGITEKLEKKIDAKQDVERWLGVTTLGSYPSEIMSADHKAIGNGKIKPAAKALLARLTVMGAGTDWRIVSLVPVNDASETSSLAASLAIAACESGLRVMLVDTRRGSQSLKMYFPDQRAVTYEVPQVIDAPPALHEAWLAQISNWRTDTDLVIVDTSPLISSPEACLAAKMSDKAIAVVRAGSSGDKCIHDCLNLLDEAGTPTLGAVIVRNAA